MNDIVKALRDEYRSFMAGVADPESLGDVILGAVDEIERLRAKVEERQAENVGRVAEVERLRRALRNVLMLARRMERRCDSPDTAETAETAHHIIRLCTDAGVHPEILRAAPAAEEVGKG